MKTGNPPRPAPAVTLGLVLSVSLVFILTVRAVDPAAAPGKKDLSISLTATKVTVQPDGQERFLPAERAVPGEIIQYDAVYSNQGRQPIRRLAPTLPIPPGMQYVPDSARPAPGEASLDGRRFESVPIKRPVALADGRVVEQEVPPTAYRALRWHVGDMAAGGTTTVIARAQLVPLPQ